MSCSCNVYVGRTTVLFPALPTIPGEYASSLKWCHHHHFKALDNNHHRHQRRSSSSTAFTVLARRFVLVFYLFAVMLSCIFCSLSRLLPDTQDEYGFCHVFLITTRIKIFIWIGSSRECIENNKPNQSVDYNWYVHICVEVVWVYVCFIYERLIKRIVY